MKLRFETLVPETFDTVKSKFNIQLLEYLSPIFPIVKIKRYDGNQVNDQIHIQLGFLLFTWTWVSKISEFESNLSLWFFVDEGIELPPFLKRWSHKHEIQKSGNEAIIIDEIDFESSRFWPGMLVKLMLWMQFSQRPALYKKYFRQVG
jgi:ligand-binding SRPBCC domain-containing protein